MLVQNGFATKSKKLDNFLPIAKELEELENMAFENKLGFHSNSLAPKVYHDLTVLNQKNSKIAQNIFNFYLQSNSSKNFKGVVEQVIKTENFFLRIEELNCIVNFCILGVTIDDYDKNYENLTAYTIDAKDFTYHKLMQRNVELKVDHISNCVYYGNLFIDNVDFAILLLQNGLAYTAKSNSVLFNYSKDKNQNLKFYD